MSKTAGKELVERYERAADHELTEHMMMVMDTAARQELAAKHRERLAELRLTMDQAVAAYEAAWYECRAEMIQAEKRCLEASSVFCLARMRSKQVFRAVMQECARLGVAPESEMEP